MPFLTFALLFVASFILQELLRPKPNIEDARPAGIGEVTVPTATEGRFVPILWGRVKIKGPNVVWYGDYRTSGIEEKVKTGLFSSDKVTTGYRYFIGLQFALCRGPIDNLVSIEVDDTEVYNTPISSGAYFINEPNLFGGEGEGTSGGGGLIGGGNLFQGTSTQAVSSYLSAFQSPQPAYRGTCYLTWEQGYIGNQPNLRNWAFVLERYPNGLAVTNAGEEKINDSANPMCVLYEILTNSEWGLNIGSSDINEANLRSIATDLATEENGFAFLWDQPKDVAEIISEIERQVDGFLFIDPTTGQYDFKLVRLDYTIGTLPVLDESNILDFRSMSRPAWDETVNVVRAQYTDRRKGYNTGFAVAQDMANAQITQAVNATTVVFPGCMEENLANSLAWREQRQLSYPFAKFTLVTNRTVFGVVQGDVFKLTWPPLGIEDLPVRVTKANYGTVIDGKITLDLNQDIFSSELGSFSEPVDTSWVAPEISPVAFDAANQTAIDAPFIMVNQQPASTDKFPRVMTMATSPGTSNTSYDIRSREAASSGGQSGSFTSRGGVFTGRLTSVGELRSSLVGTDSTLPAQGVGDFTIDPISGDSLDFLIGETFPVSDINNFTFGVGVIDPGTVDEEWFICQAIVDDGAGVELQDVYRGALDSVPKAHSAGDKVWLAWVGGSGLTDFVYDLAEEWVELKLVPSVLSEELAEASAIAFEIELFDEERYARPLSPTELFINGVRYPASADTTFDTDPGAPVVLGLDFSYLRRQWRQTGAYDSVNGLDTNGNLFQGSPAAADNLRYFWWIYDLEAIPSPTSRAQAFFSGNTDATSANNSFVITRASIFANNSNIMPDEMRIEIAARHSPPDMPVVPDTESTDPLIFDFDVTLLMNSTMNVGTDGANLRGYRDPAHPTSQFGTLTPNTIKGFVVWDFTGNTATNLLVMALGTGSTQIPNVNNLTVRFDTTIKTTLVWNGGTTQYETTDAAAVAYLAANVGNNITVRVT